MTCPRYLRVDSRKALGGSGPGKTYAAKTVVLVVVLGLLDHVPPHDVGIAVLVLFVGDKVDLFEELLLVMF